MDNGTIERKRINQSLMKRRRRTEVNVAKGTSANLFTKAVLVANSNFIRHDRLLLLRRCRRRRIRCHYLNTRTWQSRRKRG